MKMYRWHAGCAEPVEHEVTSTLGVHVSYKIPSVTIKTARNGEVGTLPATTTSEPRLGLHHRWFDDLPSAVGFMVDQNKDRIIRAMRDIELATKSIERLKALLNPPETTT